MGEHVICIHVRGVAVKLQRRSDGGLRAYSDELPGLVLSSMAWWKVLLDIEPAIKVLQAFDRSVLKAVK